MLGNGAGGAGVHWNAETRRFSPTDFTLKSHLTQRYGANFLPADMTIQDWGVTWDDLDDQVADVLTHVRNSWGNSASAVDPASIKKARQALVERSD